MNRNRNGIAASAVRMVKRLSAVATPRERAVLRVCVSVLCTVLVLTLALSAVSALMPHAIYLSIN